MPKAKFVATWDPSLRSRFKYPPTFLLIHPNGAYVDDLKQFFGVLGEWQRKKKQMRELSVTIEYHYRKRSLDANALMWALYEIEAHEMNAGLGDGIKEHMITPEKIYEDDLTAFAPTVTVEINREYFDAFEREHKRIKHVKSIDDTKLIVTYIVSSSQWDTKQMHEWIEMIFNRLAYGGVSLDGAADIKDYWRKWRQIYNDAQITITDTPMSIDDYKTLHPICEATGEFIGNGGGSLAHIKAIGMGGPRPNHVYPSEVMHLTDKAHAMFDNGKGRDVFLKTYPHLKYKIETALRREYNFGEAK